MSNGLLEQLAEYGSATRSEREPVTPADVFDRSGPIRLIEQQRMRTTRPRWYVAVAVAIVSVVAFGTVALLADRAGNNSVTDEPPVSVTQPPDTVAPPTTVAAEEMAQTTTTAVGDTAPSTTIDSSLDAELLGQPGLKLFYNPGTYETDEFPSGFSFTVPARWGKRSWYPGTIELFPMADYWDHSIRFAISSQKSVDAVVDGWLDAARYRDDNDIDTVPPTDVVLGGASGKTFEMRQTVFQKRPQTVGANGDQDDHRFEDLGLPDLDQLASLPFGLPIRIHVISVGGKTVFVWVDTSDFGTAFVDEAQTVLDSIVWHDELG